MTNDIDLSSHSVNRYQVACAGPRPPTGKRPLAQCKAMFDALACAERGFTRAGVTFEQTDRQVTLVKHSGFTVAELKGRFGTNTVVNLIRKGLEGHARSLVEELGQALTGLKLPAGHSFRLDAEQNVNDIVTRGATTLKGYIGGRVVGDQTKIWGEIHFSLVDCRARISLNAGDRFCDEGSLLSPDQGLFSADTYAELADQVVSSVNASILKHSMAPH